MEIDDLIFLKKELLWAEGMKDVELYLASQSKEIRLIQDMQMLSKNYDSGFIDKAKQLQDIGFENFEPKAKEEFLDQFLHCTYWDDLPSFFEDSNYALTNVSVLAECGMRDNKGDWVYFDEWSGSKDWEPGSEKMEKDELPPIHNPDQEELF